MCAPRTWMAMLLALALPGCGHPLPEPDTLQTTGLEARYLGSATCQNCHPVAFAAWQGSDHAKAMAKADGTSILGDFADAEFDHEGIQTRFFRRDGDWYVRTDGADGQLSNFKVAYTFGHDPLQQYLVAFPDGRLQALPIAWDSRPRQYNGQRWLHLYPDEHIGHDNILHWTGPALNWDRMCAQCHSTGVEQQFDAASGRFNTRWSEINVACEACHGPASRHVQWARAPDLDPRKGLTFTLRGRSASHWQFSADHPTAKSQGNTPPDRSEVETCAGCHARRAEVATRWEPGQPLAATHHLALLEEGLYFSDGQQHDEVFEYGSFLQSRMYQAGVTCTHCHEPHSGALRATGNAICTQCHQSTVFDSVQHHHHRKETTGSQCINCHMPTRTYMQIDVRRDHSFRIPRPDLSVSLHTPDACTGCHDGRSPAWAAQHIAQWYPERIPTSHFANALHAGRNWQPGAPAQLEHLFTDATQPAIIRASALQLLVRYPGQRLNRAVNLAITDPDPLLRQQAAAALPSLPLPQATRLAATLLIDPMLTVRMEAVQRVLELPPEVPRQLDPAHWQQGLDELRAGLDIRRDRASSLLGLAALAQYQGDAQASEALLRQAIARQPHYAPGWIQLSHVVHDNGDVVQAKALLRKALGIMPDLAELHYALAMAQIRAGNAAQAVPALARAAQLAPHVPHYHYAHAIAVHETGQPESAIKILQDAIQNVPGHPGLLRLLVQYATLAQQWQLAQQAFAQFRDIDPEG